MELVLVPQSAHGNFYEGDCYVILSVSSVFHVQHSFLSRQFPGRRNPTVRKAGACVCLDSPSWHAEPQADRMATTKPGVVVVH